MEAAPKPEDWPVLIEKLKELDADPHGWPDAEVAGIEAPTLIVMGDADVVRPEHGGRCSASWAAGCRAT